ncbi:MAG: hypothetical protein IJC56_11885 [Clostridia bacterium]|nr:hypothetical protein [Clostridia bacterium]
MKAKKIAVRGLIALAVLVAVCIFFSGTIRTIATAKVKITQPRSGKLTQTVELTGALNFPVEEDVYIEGNPDIVIEVKSVKVEVGYEVEEGDAIFTGQISGYDKTMETYRQTYLDTQNTLQTLEDKNIRLKKTDETWAAAYEALAAAREAYLDADLKYRARLNVEELEDTDGLPEKASEELAKLFEARETASAALDSAQSAMDDAERYNISDEVRAYLTDRIKYTQSLKKTEQEMLELTVLNESVKNVTAAMDGFITKINVRPGETFAISGAAYSICPEDELPVVRCDTSNCELTITKKMDAILVGATGENVESEVDAVGVTLAGGEYADIELKKGMIKDMGGMYAMSANGVSVRIEYRSKNATTLLPAAAVRGGEGDRYVYTLRTEESMFGTQQTVTVKQPVTVLAEADGTVSIEEDLTYTRIAYMEDRAISEGDAVMEYSE